MGEEPAQLQDRVPSDITNRYSEKTRRAPYKRLLEEVGIETGGLRALVLDRMALLDAKTKTVEDEMRSVDYSRRLAIAPEKRPTVEAATVLADIGKTGGAKATAEEAATIANIYAIDKKIDLRISLSDFLSQFFSGNTSMVKNLEALGIDLTMNMRAFFNLHAGWSLEIMKASNIPAEAALSAASHHLLEGVNPDGIINIPEGRFQALGVSRELDEREVWVILLDKYDAARRRGNKTHREAIDWLREFAPRSPVLEELPERMRGIFMRCIEALAERLQDADAEPEALPLAA